MYLPRIVVAGMLQKNDLRHTAQEKGQECDG